jgi:hypothetical protein
MPKQRYITIANISDNSQTSSNSVDLNRNSSAEYDFSNIKNNKITEILNKIPSNAIKRILVPSNNIAEGFEYKWSDNYITWRVRFHSPDNSAPEHSNAALGWVVRIQRGKHFMDSSGVFHPPGIFNIQSPNFNEDICNDTHIPVENDL